MRGQIFEKSVVEKSEVHVLTFCHIRHASHARAPLVANISTIRDDVTRLFRAAIFLIDGNARTYEITRVYEY